MKNKIIIKDKHSIILTRKNEEILIDNEDVEKISQYSWSLSNGYAQTRIGTKIFYMHKLLINSNGLLIDHINHNKSDNRKSNLRICTKQQNCMNRKLQINNTTGTPGIQQLKNKSWRAYIIVNKKTYWLGQYKDKEEAIKARKEGEEKYFKDFRNTIK